MDSGATGEAERLRKQAARCLRLAGQVVPDDVSRNLRALAADYLKKAKALETTVASQQQQQVGHMPSPPEPGRSVMQQQQQPQPKDKE